MFPKNHSTWMWKALAQLNKLRNRVAHNLEPVDREPLMHKVIQLIPGAPRLGEGEPLQTQFELALWSLHTAVSELVEPVRGLMPQLVVRNDAI